MQGTGNGPIDAFVQGLAMATGQSVRVLDYHEHAIGAGAARAGCRLPRAAGRRQHLVRRRAWMQNIVSASLKAIVSGLQRAGATVPQPEPVFAAAK